MQFLHVLLALLLVSVWGFNLVVVKIGLQEIPPLFLVFARFFFTSIPAIFFVERPKKAHMKMVVFYGLIMFALQFSFLFFGMSLGATAGLASLILQLQVFFTLLLALIFLGEKIGQWQILGAMVSFFGIACVGSNLDGMITLEGFFLIISAAFFWGIGNIISKTMDQVNTLSLVVWGGLFAWPPMLAASLFLEGADSFFFTVQHLSWTSVGAVFYITFLATLFCFGVWSWLLRQYPLGTIAPFSLLVPIFGTLSSALILEEPLQRWKLLAAFLVISGLCINLLGPRLQTLFSQQIKANENE